MRERLAGVGVTGLAGPVTLLALLLCPGSAVVPAERAASPAVAPGTDETALRLLTWAAHASVGTAYHGTQFVSARSRQGSTSLVVEVTHRPGYGTRVRSEGTALTGAADTFVRDDDGVPSLLGTTTALGLLARNYDVALKGERSVAGRDTHLLEATRRGASSPSARFWVDRASGLVLRREVYDERGRATRASAFVEIEIGNAATDSHLPPAMPDRWVDELDAADVAAMRARGWTCPNTLPGSLQLVDARRGERAIVHLSYSDGLASVSLFQQGGRLDEQGLDGYRPTEVHGASVFVRDGVPRRVVWEADGRVFTVVADASPRTVDRVVAALPHDPGDSGWRRLGRGLDRVASWFNPFE